MSFSGNKRKGAPGDVLDEERMPADPADPAAGTLRGEKIMNRCLAPLPDPLAWTTHTVMIAQLLFFLSSFVSFNNSRWKACT